MDTLSNDLLVFIEDTKNNNSKNQNEIDNLKQVLKVDISKIQQQINKNGLYD